MGKNYSLYLNDQYAKFVDKFIGSISKYVQGKLDFDMANNVEFFKNNIQQLKKEIEQQEKLMKEAEQNGKKAEESYYRLRKEYLSRPSGSTRDGFLTGSRGKDLLRKARMTKGEFLEKVMEDTQERLT